MRILFAHNRYQQFGGEDVVFENEVKLLTAAGHDVRALVVSNAGISSYWDKALTAIRTSENSSGMEHMRQALKNFKADIVHVHNFFPLLSPGVYRVCREAGSAVVQTLHNYRPICANGQLFRDNHVCRLCIQGSPVWGVLHRCYRNSIVGSAAMAHMIVTHKRRHTWANYVDRFIALSEFGRKIFVDAGFPEERIDVKPNFMEDPGEPLDVERKGVLFVGRLSEEKGVEVLIKASMQHDIPVRVAGEGPQLKYLRSLAHPNVAFLGHLSRQAILDEMRHSVAVIMPSRWYEGFPMAIVEAFACGTPVVASRLGALAEIVDHGVNGLLVPPGDPDNLGKCIKGLLTHPTLSRQLGYAARQSFVQRYTPKTNVSQIEAIYTKAAEHSHLLTHERSRMEKIGLAVF
jgi:glycosyltransferase involved in cell wall biosynthesis